MDNQKNKTFDRVHVTLRSDQKQWLDDIKERYGVQSSIYIRKLLDREIARQKKANAKNGAIIAV